MSDKSLYKKLLAVQGELPAVSRDKENPHFKSKYASLENIMHEVLPVLNRHGLVLLQMPEAIEAEGGGIITRVMTRVIDVDTGERVDCCPGVMVSGDPQKIGSAITYLRRYGFALLGLITDDDDDGNASSASTEEKKGTGKTGDTQDKRANDNRKEIGRMLMEIADGDSVLASELLEYHTRWEDKEGKKRDGNTSVKALSDKATFPVLKTITAVYDEWKKGRDDEPEKGEVKDFKDADIPF